MEFELWWLLGIPLFFALGWIAARVDIKQLLAESRSLPTSYFKGLNFLLNARPDLPLEQQEHARYELGMDYLKAGLLDRSEETFNLLLDSSYGVQARRAL